jgi:hypothetical protein
MGSAQPPLGAAGMQAHDRRSRDPRPHGSRGRGIRRQQPRMAIAVSLPRLPQACSPGTGPTRTGAASTEAGDYRISRRHSAAQNRSCHLLATNGILWHPGPAAPVRGFRQLTPIDAFGTRFRQPPVLLGPTSWPRRTWRAASDFCCGHKILAAVAKPGTGCRLWPKNIVSASLLPLTNHLAWIREGVTAASLTQNGVQRAA